MLLENGIQMQVCFIIFSALYLLTYIHCQKSIRPVYIVPGNRTEERIDVYVQYVYVVLRKMEAPSDLMFMSSFSQYFLIKENLNDKIKIKTDSFINL